MIPLHLEEDYQYFESIWDYKDNSGISHTSELWDERAKDWEVELENNDAFRDSLYERIGAVQAFLKANGLLKAEDVLLDIGCGPGRFVVEFAKDVKTAVASDLSPGMLELGRQYAQRIGQNNIEYLACDFQELDVEKQGWLKRFDLVFTSITPAIGTMEALEKMAAISKAYCFNSCFIHRKDDLELHIAEAVFGVKDLPKTGGYPHWFYSLFNLLWLQGYLPITQYHRHHRKEKMANDDALLRYYMRVFSEYSMPEEEKSRAIAALLQNCADAENMVERSTEHWYGWLLWDVREEAKRIV